MNQTIFLLLGVLGLAGIGSLVASNDDDSPPAAPENPFGDRDVIEGTNDADTIDATAGDDAILSYGGNDSVDAGEGDDQVWTGYGNDTVVADAGDDEIYLGFDDDTYGALDLGADEGNDTIDGGSGNDTIITNSGEHSITGGDGADSITDNGGTVHIDGGADNDVILSSDDSTPEAQDTLLGGDGNDTIHAGGNDLVDGGDGEDLIVISNSVSDAVDITYSSSDSITLSVPADYSGDEEPELVQDGDDVHVVLNGEVLAVLRDTEVKDVGNIAVERATA